jgi:hypothetical protein
MMQNFNARLEAGLQIVTPEDGKPRVRAFDGHAAVSPTETAQYIADIVLDLRKMANADNHKALRDLLELCFYEASFAASRSETASDKSEKPFTFAKALAA